MITTRECFAKYGVPEREIAMVLWDVPSHLEIGHIPKKIYCNRDLVLPLEMALTNLVQRGLIGQLKTWDGCFNIRKKRGATSPSLHSWGIAIDVNAAWNRFGCSPSCSKEFVRCFTDGGFDWGGEWRKKDGMHFQLAKI
ncbi:MAG: M15 family metallopeptidase [Methylococcales bacterium]